MNATTTRYLAHLPDILTVQEVADFFSLDRHLVYRYLEEGHLRALPRLGEKGPYRILKCSIEAFLASV